jgi:hypothetical protein
MNTNEILGYPKDARLLIVNIDDYGCAITLTYLPFHCFRKVQHVPAR